MVRWKRIGGDYLCNPTGQDLAEILKVQWGMCWEVWYGDRFVGDFKTLRRAKAWIEEVAPQIDEGGDYDTGPESERGPDWFGNDGIDYRWAA